MQLPEKRKVAPSPRSAHQSAATEVGHSQAMIAKSINLCDQVEQQEVRNWLFTWQVLFLRLQKRSSHRNMADPSHRLTFSNKVVVLRINPSHRISTRKSDKRCNLCRITQIIDLLSSKSLDTADSKCCTLQNAQSA